MFYVKRYFRRRLFGRLLRVILAAFFIYFLSIVFTGNYNEEDEWNEHATVHQEYSSFYETIPANCACVEQSTSIRHNFCYRLPPKFGMNHTGERFSCEWLAALKELKLLNLDVDSYFRFDRDQLPSQPPFVTAASEGYFNSVLALLASLHQNFLAEGQRFIVYDLGLNNDSVDILHRLCNVEYRRLAFEKYPKHVRKLHEYRWKPLVIADALKSFNALWYMDSSLKITKNNLSHVYSLLTCRKGNSHGVIHNPNEGPTVDPPEFVESGFHIDGWSKAIRRCDKSAYMLQGFTGHGIFSATNPGVYRYIPTDEKKMKNEHSKMYEAGHVFVVRTFEVVQDILKWYVLCALESDCMAPPGAHTGCSFGSDRYGVYAGCHRFDQSIINLLLANRNYFTCYYYKSGIVDFFEINRGQQGTLDNTHLKQCA